MGNNQESGVFPDDVHIPKDGTISPSTDREEVQISSVGEILQSKGVTRMEAVYREAKQNRLSLYLVGASVLVCAWAYSLDGSTTSYYSIDASSYYQQHSSVLSTLSIATNIISAVSKPFIAKISDITSRPYTYIITLLFYVVGYIIAASSTSISAYVVGEVFVAIGSSGLDLTNDIIVADLTPLEWRGFVSSLLSTPFIINTWFAGKIVDAMQAKNQWRWGYGMFAIIMPAALGPAIGTLLYLDKKAKKDGIVNIASSNAARRAARDLAGEKGYEGPHGAIVAPAAEEKTTWTQSLKRNLIEIDAFGLILLGFGWSLLLLPFSLKTYADHGWRNQSLIAMMVVGGVLLIAYVVYEIKWAKVPSAPRRLVMNKTFLMAIVIDAFYMLAGNIRGLYWSSYVYIAKPWSSQNWVYYNNTLTLALCVFGLVAGLIQRWTHRYKLLQIIGLCIKIIGMGIMLDGPRATISTAPMVLSLVMIGCGGAFSVVGSRVASQASVPHQDVALAIALLSLWSKIGSSIGSAIVAVIWADKMPKLLRQYLPATATDKDVKSLFNSVRTIRTKYAFDDPMRQGAIEAYRRTLYYCLAPAVALAFIPLIAALFQTNFYLGKQQNAVTNVGNDGEVLKEEDRNPEALPPAKNKKEAFLRFWAGRQ
ncbi:siderophore iron transporter [Colletotrichum musicola]|uniref:Siderophore iron transporter n=1 Tax=Colletotrichum musicola TaxID=2175873 RepID=A0A8H6KDW4_9PEZI|nr:siderophore iron transporter [Colletotrichum musicola]